METSQPVSDEQPEEIVFTLDITIPLSALGLPDGE
jgi:hypothetical protein